MEVNPDPPSAERETCPFANPFSQSPAVLRFLEQLAIMASLTRCATDRNLGATNGRAG